MTMQDAHNLRLRLERQGDTDAAEGVRTLLIALELASSVDPNEFLKEATGREA